MFGNVTALVGWIYIGELQKQKHAAHMLQACGLGSSQVMSACVLLRADGRSRTVQRWRPAAAAMATAVAEVPLE